MNWRYRLRAWAYLPPDTANQGNYGVLADGSTDHVWTWRIPDTDGTDLFVDMWTTTGEGQMAAPVPSTISRPPGVHPQPSQVLHIAPGRFTLAWRPPITSASPDVKVRSYEVPASGASLAISADVPMVAAYRAVTGFTTAEVSVETSTWYDRDNDCVHVLANCHAPVPGGAFTQSDKFVVVYSRVNADGTYTTPSTVTADEVVGAGSTAHVDVINGGHGVPRLGTFVVPFHATQLVSNVVGEPIHWSHGWIDFGSTGPTVHVLDQVAYPRPEGGFSYTTGMNSDALDLGYPARSSGDLAHFIWSVVPPSDTGLPRRRFAGVKGNAPLEIPTSSNTYYTGQLVHSHTVVPNSTGAFNTGYWTDEVFEEGTAEMDIAEGPDEWLYWHPDGTFEAGDRLQVPVGNPGYTGYSYTIQAFLSTSPITMVNRGNIGGTPGVDWGADFATHPAWTVPDDYPHGALQAPAIQIVEHLPATGWLVGAVGFNL